MITIYQLYNLTGYHPHSRTKWTRKYFHITTKESKQVGYEGYEEAYELLKMVSKKPDYKGLLHYFSTRGIESHSDQMINIMNKNKEEEFKTIIKQCSNCFYFGVDKMCDCSQECISFNRWLPAKKLQSILPGITKDDYTVLKNCFDDLLEMYQELEQKLLVIEKRLELPQRSFRNEVISKVNEIARKLNKPQKEIYKEVYQSFDARLKITNETKNKDTKISYLEWYDKHGFMPMLLNYIKEVYKV